MLHKPPPPFRPPTSGLRSLTFFFPPDRVAIHRLSDDGFKLARMLRGVRIAPDNGKR